MRELPGGEEDPGGDGGSMKRWTPEEEDYLSDRWGTISIPAIAKHLGRSVNAEEYDYGYCV